VTLATNDSYAVGALTLAQSLKRVNTTKQLCVLLTEEVSEEVKNVLEETFDRAVVVDPLDSKDIVNLKLLERTELGITFTKIHCWRLTEYSKCVFLDADTLLIHNSDELFEREELSASPDAGWPDCFNSGVFVFRPSLNTYQELLKHAVSRGSFDGGDQGLLNTYFSDWATKDINRHIPFIYNMVASASYSYLPAFTYYGSQVKIVHFIGATKPWLINFDEAGRALIGDCEKHCHGHLQLWWQIFNNMVRPLLNRKVTDSRDGDKSVLPCLRTVTNSHYMESPPSPTSPPPLPSDTRQNWEAGSPDYMGSASFTNILKKIDRTLDEEEVIEK